MHEHLKTNVKVARAGDLTQAELADLAGTTRKSVNAVEMGHIVPSPVLALKLARAMRATVETLFYLRD
ncbi:MAG: helix-turn-helix transcriptional regulator [Pseudomonadota bacterium]|nr:helix-turn-helix transcriptional regulator [Pseudomonadota bacterium]